MSCEKTPDPCKPEIYRDGTMVMMTHSIPSNQMEKWVKKVAKVSGQPVDWHFAGGRACVLALGDLGAVRSAILELIPEHNKLQLKEVSKDLNGIMLENVADYCGYTLYGEDEWNPAHEYARQMNLGRIENDTSGSQETCM